MDVINKILIIGNDNTTRSIMAESILKNIAQNENIEIDSKGLVVLFPEPFNQKVELVLHSHGCKTKEGMSVALEEADIDQETLILTVNFVDKVKILETFNNLNHIFTIKEFIGEEGEILDPYGEDLEEYVACYEQLAVILQKVFDKIKNNYII